MDKVVKGSALADVDDKGTFRRKDSVFRNKIEVGGKYPPEAGRYILYISYACPWASRCSAYMYAKGLQKAIQLVVVSPVWGRTKPDVDEHCGWVFDPSFPGASKEPLGLFKTVRDIYDLSMKNSSDSLETRFTVPVLFDTASKTIVNNESSEIIRMFNSAFNDFAAHPEVDLSPEELIPAIDAMNTKTYEPICNGVYKCGFAQKQSAYEEAAQVLFSTLDEIDGLLGKQRYLVAPGNRVTEADVRLFMCLVRFEEVYSVHFKCNTKPIRDYANIMGWLRDVYQTLNLAPTVNMHHIKDHYYRSHPSLNPLGLVPVGANFMKTLDEPHNRS